MTRPASLMSSRGIIKNKVRLPGAPFLLASLCLLGSCTSGVSPTSPGQQAVPSPGTSTPENAVTTGVKAGPAVADIVEENAHSKAALAAFRISCPSLIKRTDASGLTTGADWADACAAAVNWPEAQSAAFFAQYFESVRVGDGQAHATGYYEPEIKGARVRDAAHQVPIYRRPADLIDVDLGQFNDAMKGKTIRGRVDGSKFVPYYERSQIVDGGVLAGRGLELAWAADPVEFFFLQIQGSGRLNLPDGTIMRIGYDAQNGRAYTGIGKLMKDRGLIPNGSMQEIIAWLHANPEEGRAIMDENKSFIFFRELTGSGPLGALGLPVTGEVSVAADPRYIPLGAPVFLSLDRGEASGLWIAQDTGGAIKGANRVDTFWGAGDRARTIAGGMSARGTAVLLLPKGSYAKLAADHGWSTP